VRRRSFLKALAALPVAVVAGSQAACEPVANPRTGDTLDNPLARERPTLSADSSIKIQVDFVPEMWSKALIRSVRTNHEVLKLYASSYGALRTKVTDETTQAAFSKLCRGEL
jgi:hypothetical protein